MAKAPDETRIWRDERAADLRERDRQRENVRGRLFPALRQDLELDQSRSVRLACPACGGPVFAPSDSDRESVSCTACHAEFATKLALDGSVGLVPVEAAP